MGHGFYRSDVELPEGFRTIQDFFSELSLALGLPLSSSFQMTVVLRIGWKTSFLHVWLVIPILNEDTWST